MKLDPTVGRNVCYHIDVEMTRTTLRPSQHRFLHVSKKSDISREGQARGGSTCTHECDRIPLYFSEK